MKGVDCWCSGLVLVPAGRWCGEDAVRMMMGKRLVRRMISRPYTLGQSGRKILGDCDEVARHFRKVRNVKARNYE